MDLKKMKKNEKQYFGVYGLFLNGSEILLVKKNRGPYKGRWDLPGGAPHYGERLEQAFCREVQEETSLTVKALDLFTTLSHLEHYQIEGKAASLYHIGVLYLVFDFEGEVKVPKQALDEISEFCWWDIEEVQGELLTPFALSAVARMMG